MLPSGNAYLCGYRKKKYWYCTIEQKKVVFASIAETVWGEKTV